MLKRSAVSVILAALMLCACNFLPNGSSIDYTAAQKVADSFMADLVGNRVNEAIEKMEPELVRQAGGPAKTEAAISNLFNYCGKPLDYQLKHDEVGFKIYLDGQKKPMRKFYYAAATTQHPKGVCFFSVAVVPDQGNLRVAEFGPLTLKSGQLPEWLK